MPGKNVGTWKCTEKCKALKQFEVDAVLEIKESRLLTRRVHRMKGAVLQR